MSIKSALQTRSNNTCELCQASESLGVYAVPPGNEETSDRCILLCSTCLGQIKDPSTVDANHWRCLNDTMWSQVPAVQVMVWRMLTLLRGEGWPQTLLDMLYLEDETRIWAEMPMESENTDTVIHRDSNGAILNKGDTITLIKDLTVKGANFTAKRGTAVRNIHLVHDNAGHIEGRVSGQRIVILTEFVKKST